jgi:hypothetical protein
MAVKIRLIRTDRIGETEHSVVGKIYESGKQRSWSLLLEAGLVDIPTDEFSERVKEAKQAVMDRLGELLETTANIEERDSAAYSLATLKKLETALQRKGAFPTAD